jgi:hypothetical protein
MIPGAVVMGMGYVMAIPSTVPVIIGGIHDQTTTEIYNYYY